MRTEKCIRLIKRLMRLIEAQEKLLVAYRLGGKTPSQALDTLSFKTQWITEARQLLAADTAGDIE